MSKKIKQYRFDYPYQYCISDENRAAFDLGWEHARRGLSIDMNPFRDSRLRFAQYRDGFQAFSDAQLRKYHAVA